MVRTVGHRGAAGIEPENTLRAFRRGMDLGVDALECDIHRTADGELVVIHDDTLDRTTNGHGAVRASTLAQIRALDAGLGEQVPTLREVLESARGRAVLHIELKADQLEARAVDEVLVASMLGQVVFTSFELSRIRALRAIEPRARTMALFAHPPACAAALAADAGASAIGILHKSLRAELVNAAHGAGLVVAAWNPDTIPEMRVMLALGVDELGSNRPDLLVPLVRGG